VDQRADLFVIFFAPPLPPSSLPAASNFFFLCVCGRRTNHTFPCLKKNTHAQLRESQFSLLLPHTQTRDRHTQNYENRHTRTTTRSPVFSFLFIYCSRTQLRKLLVTCICNKDNNNNDDDNVQTFFLPGVRYIILLLDTRRETGRMIS